MTSTDLRTARKQLGLTQAELADAYGVSRMTIVNWERGAYAVPKWVPLALDGIRYHRSPVA
jgi:DNA-binding XRE family transcriptional regulator